MNVSHVRQCPYTVRLVFQKKCELVHVMFISCLNILLWFLSSIWFAIIFVQGQQPKFWKLTSVIFIFFSKPHRISVRSVTHDRRTSRDAACTMIIGRDTAHLGPSAVRASSITCSSAVISWLPANTNHQHVVCVNNVEVKVVKPGVYRQTITGII